MSAPAIQEDRTQFIGGSEVGAILGVDPYKTRLQVYEEKVGIAPPFEGNQHTRRGTRLEEVAAEEFSMKHGLKLHRVNERIVDPEYPFLTARIDRRIVGQKAHAEFKVPSLGSFSKIKREGLHEGYIAQQHTYLGLTRNERGYWGIFNADLWEIVDFPVDADRALWLDIRARLVAFWTEHVMKRVPPPAVQADEERIELARAEGTAKVVTVTDPLVIEAMQNLRDAKKLAKDAETIEADAKARLVEFLGDNAFAVYNAPGVKVNWYPSKGRSSFDQKALAGARPLDRIAVGVALQPWLEAGERFVSAAEVERMIQAVGAADLDLSKFEKRGNDFGVMRVSEPKGK